MKIQIKIILAAILSSRSVLPVRLQATSELAHACFLGPVSTNQGVHRIQFCQRRAPIPRPLRPLKWSPGECLGKRFATDRRRCTLSLPSMRPSRSDRAPRRPVMMPRASSLRLPCRSTLETFHFVASGISWTVSVVTSLRLFEKPEGMCSMDRAAINTHCICISITSEKEEGESMLTGRNDKPDGV